MPIRHFLAYEEFAYSCMLCRRERGFAVWIRAPPAATLLVDVAIDASRSESYVVTDSDISLPE